MSINLREDPAAVQGFVRTHGLSYPVLLDGTGQVAEQFRVRSIPLFVLIDASGRERWRGHQLPPPDEVARQLR